MRYYILLIVIYCNMVQCLNGSLGSICYKIVRIEKSIAIAPNVFKNIYDIQPLEKCCTGYSEVNGECKPICEPNCDHGTCIAPNVCECDGFYLEPLCDEKLCPPGYKGEGDKCDEKCSKNTYGNNCEKTCECHNGDCDFVTGNCTCHEVWYGTNCSECKCSNNGNCDSDTGTCKCTSGYTGKFCEKECEKGFWGLGCQEKCNCRHYNCNAITGKCENDCIQGEICDMECACIHGRCTYSGDCECYPGWRGETCDEECEEGYYGPGCELKCTLYDSVILTCDPKKGVICKPGYNEPYCIDLCPDGTFGTGCMDCSCEHASKCNKSTGECECQPGWYGNKCNLPCIEGWHGKRCQYQCSCPKCRATDGFCPCQDGWNGMYCQDYCPPTFFNTTINQCVDVEPARVVQVNVDTLVKISAISIFLALFLLSAVIITMVCIRRMNEKKRANEAKQRYGPLLYKSVETPENHIYEEIPEQNTYDQYNKLLHIPVEDGYIPPKKVASPVQNKLYNTSSENRYVLPRRLMQKSIMSRSTLPSSSKENQWRTEKVKSSI